MSNNPIHVHVHLPERLETFPGDGPHHEHIHLYLRGSAEAGARPAGKVLFLAALFLIPASAGYLFLHRTTVSAAPAQSAQAPAAPGQGATLPPAFAQELAKPLRITPPAGAAPGNAPSGPAAFGLH